MEHRAYKNGPNSITATSLIRAILKTCLDVVSSKLGSFDKLGENHPLIVKAISPILDEYKIFAKVPHPLIKCDQKHDGKVTESVRQTNKNCCKLNFLQKIPVDAHLYLSHKYT